MIQLDHFIVGVPRLDSAMEAFAQASGVKPQLGGKHPRLGTHNGLVSLGSTYLELIAFDGSERANQSSLLAGLDGLNSEKLFGWCLRCDNFDEIRVSLHSFGLALSEIGEGQRITPDGNLIRYQYGEIEGLDEPSPIIPFFVRWHSDTVQPSASAPKGCSLAEFSVSNHEESAVVKWLTSLNLAIKLETHQNPKLSLRVNTLHDDLNFTS